MSLMMRVFSLALSEFGLGVFRCVAVEHAFSGFNPETTDCQARKPERSGLRVRHKLSAE